MIFKDTTATQKVFHMKGRIRAVAGGTSASKTISILIWCIRYAQQDNHRGELISVVSESYPHLQHGAMLDFKAIMQGHGYWSDEQWHDTRHTYTFTGTGVRIEFLAIDSYGKAHGPRRDVLFINECNNLEYGLVDQLITRTRKIVWLDWNPTTEFWFYTRMLPERSDIDFQTLTYLDNEALDPVTVAEIESHKANRNWWTVYGLGQLGAVEGRIYKDWARIDEVPHEARLIRRWLDFGYSNDPTAIGDVYAYNGGYVLDEQLYAKGKSNKSIADFLLTLPEPSTLVMADSSEPKSIDEIKSYGVSVLGAAKGPGSISKGIQFVQGQRISATNRSVNLWKEYNNYMWKTDRDGTILNIPDEGYDHHMDGLRYAFEGLSDREPRLAVFGSGDSVTRYGAPGVTAPLPGRGYAPKRNSVRTF
jgi:phage terminase large subunit